MVYFLHTFHWIEEFPFSKKCQSFCLIKEKTIPRGNFKEKHWYDGIVSPKLKTGMLLNVSVTLFLQKLEIKMLIVVVSGDRIKASLVLLIFFTSDYIIFLLKKKFLNVKERNKEHCFCFFCRSIKRCFLIIMITLKNLVEFVNQ